MNLLVGALAMGLVLSLLTLGVMVSFRILHALDLTTDGAFGLGAGITAALLGRSGVAPVTATAAAIAGGALAGVTTAVVHRGLRVNLLLAGVLTSTALYSVTLWVMGGGDLAVGAPTLFSAAVYDELLALRGDVGARAVVIRDPSRVAAAALEWPAPRDVDTQDDLAAVIEELSALPNAEEPR